jgi:hypothetical protein
MFQRIAPSWSIGLTTLYIYTPKSQCNLLKQQPAVFIIARTGSTYSPHFTPELCGLTACLSPQGAFVMHWTSREDDRSNRLLRIPRPCAFTALLGRFRVHFWPVM